METVIKLIVVGAIVYLASLFVTPDQLAHALRGLILMTFNESSIVWKHENPSTDELRAILGSNWAIARRTPRNIERYEVNGGGRCITERQYKQAVELALDSRLMDGAGI